MDDALKEEILGTLKRVRLMAASVAVMALITAVYFLAIMLTRLT